MWNYFLTDWIPARSSHVQGQYIFAVRIFENQSAYGEVQCTVLTFSLKYIINQS